jgi:hypothetical protein
MLYMSVRPGCPGIPRPTSCLFYFGAVHDILCVIALIPEAHIRAACVAAASWYLFFDVAEGSIPRNLREFFAPPKLL